LGDFAGFLAHRAGSWLASATEAAVAAVNLRKSRRFFMVIPLRPVFDCRVLVRLLWQRLILENIFGFSWSFLLFYRHLAVIFVGNCLFSCN
jgi:hypothetical protein